MALSLAQMRESGAVGLPTEKIRICLAQPLVSEVQELHSEKNTLAEELAPEDGKPSRPSRMSDPRAVRIAEIDARLAELLAEMEEHTGELLLRSVTAGEWRRWADANPARRRDVDADGEPIIEPLDAMHGYGLVNITALLDTLDTYAVAWNGTALGPGDWEFIAQNAHPGDLSAICKSVVRLHEGSGLIPKLSTPSSATESAATD